MACVFNFNAVNEETGVESPSQLWDELNNLFKSHSLAKMYYGIATDREFLSVADPYLSYNSLGEPLLESFLNFIGESANKEVIKDSIAKRLGKEPMNFSDAIYKILGYNNNNDGSEVMVTFEEVNDGSGKVVLKVIDKSNENKAELVKRLLNRTITDRLMYYLRQAGGDVKYDKGDIKSRFLPRVDEAEKNAEGLYNLILLSRGLESDIKLGEDLAYRCGDFVVAAMGGREHNSTVNRLCELLEGADIIKEFLDRNPEFHNLGWSSTTDPELIAAFLIGELLLHGADRNATGQDSLTKIGRAIVDNAATRAARSAARWALRPILKGAAYLLEKCNHHWTSVIAARIRDRITPNGYLDTIRKCRDLAELMAEGFTLEEFSKLIVEGETDLMQGAEAANKFGSVVATHNDGEKAVLSNNMKAVKHTFDEITKLTTALKNINKEQYKLLQKELAKAQAKVDLTKLSKVEDAFLDAECIEALYDILDVLLKNLLFIEEDLKGPNFNNMLDFLLNAGKYANDIRTSLLYANTVLAIANYIDKRTVTGSDISDKDLLTNIEFEKTDKWGMNTQTVNLRDKALLLVEEFDRGVKPVLKAKMMAFNTLFFKEVIGSELINHADRVVFDISKERIGQGGRRYLGTVNIQGGKSTVSELLTEMGEDIHWWNRYFATMSNNPDIIGQAFDKIVKIAKYKANSDFLRERSTLLLLHKEALKRGVKMRDLYATDEDKEFTGYLKGYVIDEEGNKIGANWGKWQEDFEEFKKELKEEFKKKFGPKKLLYMTDTLKCVEWNRFFDKKYKEWHAKNTLSVPVKLNGKVVDYIMLPNPDVYRDDSYYELDEDQRFVLDRYIDWKREQDKFLPKGSTQVFRAPLMLGTTMNKIENRRLLGEGIVKSMLGGLMRKICDSVTRNANDTDYGSDNTLNSPDILYDALEVSDCKFERVPFFYIRLLEKEKRKDLSTDLIGSSMAYSAMVHLYDSLSQIKDFLELGRELLKDRKILKKKEDDLIDHGSSNAYKRISSFMDKELYGLTFKNTQSSFGAAFSKFILNTSALASRMFLGGNWQGGGANLLMGISEVMKESGAGEFYNFKDLRAANSEYFFGDRHNSTLILDSFRLIKKCKINRFAEKFDVFGDNSREFKDYRFKYEKDVKGRSINLENFRTIDPWYNGDFAFMPYSMGDHYMLIIPFVAMAKHLKLYYVDESGETISTNVYDIYSMEKETENINISEEDGTLEGIPKNGELVVNPNIQYVKKREDIKKVLELNEKLKKLKQAHDALQFFLTLNDANVFGYEGTSKEVFDSIGIEIMPKDADPTKKNKEALRLINNEVKKVSDEIYNKTWLFEDEAKLKMKGREVCNRLHGVYNSLDKTELLQYVLGNMILAMRGYALGMIERRMSSSHYSLALDQDVEGTNLTALKVFARSIGDPNSSIWKTLLMGLNPVKSQAEKKDYLRLMGFSDHLYYNMRRFGFDWAVILATSILTGGLFRLFGYHGLLGRPRGSDPDDYYPKNRSDWPIATLYYFLTRLNAESSAFNDVLTFTKGEAPNLLTLVGSNMSAFNNMIEILSLMMSGEEYQKGPHKGEKKWRVKYYKLGLFHINPLYGLRRYMYTVNEDPRKAGDSFVWEKSQHGK